MINLFLSIIVALTVFTGNTTFLQAGNNLVDGLLQSRTNISFSDSESNKIGWELTEAPSQPIKIVDGEYFPQARAVVAFDLASGKIIYQRNQDSQLPIASLTKLMTAYVTMKSAPLDRVIEVTNYNLRNGDSRVNLIVGDSLTVEALLSALLIESGSDAAQVLADNILADRATFIARMNQTAVDLSLDKTSFDNPVGWDSQQNFSSAGDMAILSRVLLGSQDFRRIVQTRAITITSQKGNLYSLDSTNYLLNLNNYFGIKTGFTDGAKGCLSSLYSLDGHEILVVVLGADNRFDETAFFLDWINRHYSW